MLSAKWTWPQRLLDVPEQLVQPDLLVVGDRGLDVPVAECPAVGRLARRRRALVLDEDLPGVTA